MIAWPLDQEPVFGPCVRCGRVLELDQAGLCVECYDARVQQVQHRKDTRDRRAYQRDRYWRDPASARRKDRERQARYRVSKRAQHRQLRASRDGNPPSP